MSNLTGFLGAAYPWVKAAHVTFVIFWMAGLFLLPRFYVYHQATTPGSAEDRAWIEREDRARTIILTPAMLIVWVLGLMLAFHLDAFNQGWFMAKLALVSR
jgi:putative membrane protein